LEEQVAAIWAGNEGFLDEVPVDQVTRFHDELREHLRAQGDIYGTIRDSGDLDEETEQQLRAEIERFANSFNVEREKALA